MKTEKVFSRRDIVAIAWLINASHDLLLFRYLSSETFEFGGTRSILLVNKGQRNTQNTYSLGLYSTPESHKKHSRHTTKSKLFLSGIARTYEQLSGRKTDNQ